MRHKGEIVERAVKQRGYSYTKLSAELEISRTTLYRKFGERNLPKWFILRIGELIKYDFSKEIPDIMLDKPEEAEPMEKDVKEEKLPELPFQQVVNPFIHGKAPLKDCETELMDLQRDYIALSNFCISLLHERLRTR